MKNKKKVHIVNIDSEADTCRKEILPKIYKAGWSDDQILEQRVFTDGPVIVIGKKAKRGKAKIADYLLRYSQNFPIAIIEAKKSYKKASAGLQQAKEYAEILELKFAYATNGEEIIEFDFLTGLEQPIDEIPRPQELWNRLNDAEPIPDDILPVLLKPFFPTPDKPPRYYQTIAINHAIQGILEGKKKLLLCLATGTGKTVIAFQIIYKLWANRWNRRREFGRPKILFIADRSILIEDPHSKDFSVFGDARCLIPKDGPLTSREVYFSTYQSLAEDDTRKGKFRDFDRDFFDLIVIDECHRGSASTESNWRRILNYFDSAVQLGLTATPLREDTRDTYLYFGNPLYTYSLKQGIADGFLAPYVVHYVTPSTDTQHGWRPEHGQTDKHGNLIPDEVYSTPDFERNLSLLPRTQAVAKHLNNLISKNGRMEKTIIFCVDQEHANQMRFALNNHNQDITKNNPNYVVRIVSEEGEVGRGFLSKFMDIDEVFPVIVTTSRLLSTGVDMPTVKNVVLFRTVNTMTEFKQIVGRGTRVREDKGKLFFRLIDYAGSANRQFADPEFNGMPPLVTSEEIDEQGNSIEDSITTEYEENEEEIIQDEFEDFDPNAQPIRREKIYVEDALVEIVAENVQILDQDGNLKTIHFTQHTKEQITTLFTDAQSFRDAWMDINKQQEIIETLENSGISVEYLEEVTQLKGLDSFDLLRHIAYGMKPLTRSERAKSIKKAELMQQYSEKAQLIIQMILEKYIEYGAQELKPGVIQVHPISEQGNIMEIVKEFGGADEFKKVLSDIRNLLYAA